MLPKVLAIASIACAITYCILLISDNATRFHSTTIGRMRATSVIPTVGLKANAGSQMPSVFGMGLDHHQSTVSVATTSGAEASSSKAYKFLGALGSVAVLSIIGFLSRQLSPPHIGIAAHAGRKYMALSSSQTDGQTDQADKPNRPNRWRCLDPDMDTSDDQQDITRGADLVDPLFRGWGNSGTHQAVMSSMEYLTNAQKQYDVSDNTFEDYYISPSFYNKMLLHISKNFMDIPRIKVPLILGIWGGKGQGKTFQTDLVYRKLGISPVVMSAGELESGNAGEPARLVRQRYREASDVVKKGKMCSLFINDLDAGAGRMGSGTQYTVNNQMVNATLMNIADNPTNVQLPGVYKQDSIPRVPIVATGNDFSTLYAPLIRDGRMEKFYWNPTRDDRIGICAGIFKNDPITRDEVAVLVDTFPGQSIDFFGSVRSRIYDEVIWEYINKTGVDNLNKSLVNTRTPPKFDMPKMTLSMLLEYGRRLVEEQDNVKRVQLADEYLEGASLPGSSGNNLLD